MLIADITLTLLGFGNISLAWSGVANKTVRVFVNGVLAFGPQAIADSEKSVTLGVTNPFSIEVHENDAGETVPPASIPLSRKPLIWWSSRAGAAEYRVYCGDQLLAFVKNDASKLHHEYQVAQDLRVDGGAWTGIRVEAVTARGRESVRPQFALYAPGIPSEPPLQIVGSAGVFAIVLGEFNPLLNENGDPVLNENGDPILSV